MGDGKASLRLQFNPKVRLAFHGATITTDAGLLAFREFDDALGLTEIAEDYLQESRTGRNILHHLVPLLRQSIYSRLAGYDDTTQCAFPRPSMRVIAKRKGGTSEMGLVPAGTNEYPLGRWPTPYTLPRPWRRSLISNSWSRQEVLDPVVERYFTASQAAVSR